MSTQDVPRYVVKGTGSRLTVGGIPDASKLDFLRAEHPPNQISSVMSIPIRDLIHFDRQKINEQAMIPLANLLIDVFKEYISELQSNIAFKQEISNRIGMIIQDQPSPIIGHILNMFFEDVYGAIWKKVIDEKFTPEIEGFQSVSCPFHESQRTTKDVNQVLAITTHAGDYSGILNENKNLVPFIIGKVYIELIKQNSAKEAISILIKNINVISDFAWSTLRFATNGFVVPEILYSDNGYLIVSIDQEESLVLKLSDKARKDRSERLKRRNTEHEQLIQKLKKIAKDYPNAVIWLKPMAIMQLWPQFRCPIQNQNAYTVQFSYAEELLQLILQKMQNMTEP